MIVEKFQCVDKHDRTWYGHISQESDSPVYVAWASLNKECDWMAPEYPERRLYLAYGLSALQAQKKVELEIGINAKGL